MPIPGRGASTRTRSIGRSPAMAGRIPSSNRTASPSAARAGRPASSLAPAPNTSSSGRSPRVSAAFTSRLPAPRPTAHDAIQAEMDALADDHFGSVPSAAPISTAALPSVALHQSHVGSPFYKIERGDCVSVAELRRTMWYDGPSDPNGRSFNASDSNLLCMDVLAPSSASAAGVRGGVGRSANPASPSSAPLCAVGSADHGLKVFQLTTMREVKTLYTKTCGHTEWVTACRFLSDRRVLSGGMDCKLCLWSDVTRGGPARCVDLLGHTGSISQVDVSESGGRSIAMSASYDRTLRIWELHGAGGAGAQLGCLAGHKGPVTQFSWRETEVLSGDRQGAVKLWDVETAQCRLTASSKRGQIGSVGHLMHPDLGHLVAFGDQGGALTVLDARAASAAKPVFQEVLHPGGMVTFIRAPTAAAVSAPLMVTCGADKRVVVRDARRGFAEVYAVEDYDDFVYSLEVYGNLLLTGTGNGRLRVHQIETGDFMYELEGNAAAIREMFASPSMLVAAGDDGKAKVFDFV